MGNSSQSDQMEKRSKCDDLGASHIRVTLPSATSKSTLVYLSLYSFQSGAMFFLCLCDECSRKTNMHTRICKVTIVAGSAHAV